MKYMYHIAENKVYCLTTYAGKTIKGVAKCDSAYDQFDEELGMKLAKLRCDFKVAKKKFYRKLERHKSALETLTRAQVTADNAGRYLDEAFNNYETIKQELLNLEEKLK